MQGYCDVYKWTILKRTSPEVKCLHPTSSRREMCTLSVSNVIYHKFSHGAAFYTLNGKNVNVMLEFDLFDGVKFHFCDVRQCNMFSRIKNLRNTCKCLYYSKSFWWDVSSCNGRKLATSEGCTCLFIFSCVLESK